MTSVWMNQLRTLVEGLTSATIGGISDGGDKSHSQPPPMQVGAPVPANGYSLDAEKVQRLMPELLELEELLVSARHEKLSSPDAKLAEELLARVRTARVRFSLVPAQYARQLVRAAKHNDLNTVRALVEQHKIGIDAQDWNGESALMVAAEDGKAEIVRYALSKRANVNHRNVVCVQCSAVQCSVCHIRSYTV